METENVHVHHNTFLNKTKVIGGDDGGSELGHWQKLVLICEYKYDTPPYNLDKPRVDTEGGLRRNAVLDLAVTYSTLTSTKCLSFPELSVKEYGHSHSFLLFKKRPSAVKRTEY